jgi:hypothetical protein
MLIVALGLSAISEVVEFGLLNATNEDYTRLRVAYILKLVFVIPMISIAAALVYLALVSIINL